MPDERQPGQDAPMWPTDDEDRGAAEAGTPEPAGNKPAESQQPADQGKPAAPSEPLWPTDDEEDPDEAQAEPAASEPSAEPSKEPAEAPADADVNKPAESDEADQEDPDEAPDEPAAAEVIKPAESEDAGQRPDEAEPEPPAEPEENKPADSEDTIRVPVEEVAEAPPTAAVNKPAESREPEQEAAEQADEIKPAESREADREDREPADEVVDEAPDEAPDEPAAPDVIKPAEVEDAGQRLDVTKPAGFVGADREAPEQVEEPRGIKPAESRGWDPERTVPTEPEREVEAQPTADLRIPEDRGPAVEDEDEEDSDGEDTQAVAVDDEPDYDKPAFENYEKPDYEKPDYEKPDYEKPDYEKPDYEKPDYEKPDYDKPDYDDRPDDGPEDDGPDDQHDEPDDEPDGESTQRVATTGEQPALLRRYVEDTQVIDLRPIQPPRRPGPPPPSSPLQRPQQQRPPGPQRQGPPGPPRPSGPPPGRVIPPVGPPRARPMRIEPRLPEPESPAERTEMFRLEPPIRREPPREPQRDPRDLQRDPRDLQRDPRDLQREPQREPYHGEPHREQLRRAAEAEPDYDDLYDRLYDDDEDDDDYPPPRRRRRKGLLITLISLVVVLAVAAGVVFLVPGVAAKLGLKGANDVAIAPPPAPVAFSPQLKGPDPQAPNPTQSGVAQALEGPASAGTLGTLTGIVIDPSDGTALWDRNSSTGLTPASTGKVLTSAAALLSLDHTTQFVTRVVQGDQPGTVVLVGGGDLTLNSLPPGSDSVYPGSAHVDDLIAQVKKATGGKVDKVLIDVHRYAGPLLAPGWDPKDVAAGYEAPMEPVMMDGGRADPTEPETSTRSPRPARAVAAKIAEALGATVPENATTVAKANAPVLGEVRSAPMVEMIDNLLQISDNMLAEGVLREVAKQNGEEVSYAGGVRAVKKVLQDNGFDVSGYQMVDGSGLSTQDKATAKLLADVLAVAAGPDGKDPRTTKLRPLLGGLPVAGGSGTLNPRFQDANSKEGKGWVRAKTGTLTGVNTLAGLVLDKDGRVLVFALMSNGGDGLQAPHALDAVAARLRECGCG